MSYVNAEQVLPQALIEEIQRYMDGGFLYIPRKKENKRGWGTATDVRRVLQARNGSIYRAYLSGKNVYTLAEEYYLSVKTIQRIVARYRADTTPGGEEA